MAKFLFYIIALSFLLRNAHAQGFILPAFLAPVLSRLATIAYDYREVIMDYTYCRAYECCRNQWISFDYRYLHYELNQRLYGQHLVSDITYKQIKGHLKKKSPDKALALSFNGMTGIGKNYVSRIIAKSIYRKGIESQYVKLIIGSHHFKHGNEIEADKRKLKDWVTEQVSKCSRSLFVFDEVEKMRPELLDVLKPFLSHYTQVDGIDYRNAIFIFMGNTGADLINKEIIRHYQEKKRREDITIKQMDKVLSKEALKKVGGFLHSTLLEHQLIDYFIPFLPLEKEHVKKCIEDSLKEKNVPVTDSIINKILNELEYFPGDSQWFSESGCKKVSSKVDQYID